MTNCNSSVRVWEKRQSEGKQYFRIEASGIGEHDLRTEAAFHRIFAALRMLCGRSELRKHKKDFLDALRQFAQINLHVILTMQVGITGKVQKTLAMRTLIIENEVSAIPHHSVLIECKSRKVKVRA